MRWARFAVGAMLVAAACTEPAASDGGSPTSPAVQSPSVSPSVAPTGPRLADGTPLPEGCLGGAGASHTVAFVADGRAWALDPDEGDLACLFPVDTAGLFAWGPQGDRVLLDDFEIRGVGPGAPELPPIDTSITAFDWGHPIGLAVAFADRRGRPWKRIVPEGDLLRLDGLPDGRYLQVAYHPSGLALGFVVETPEGQEIWLSTNEGRDPQRLVFSQQGTEFTSIAFSANGRTLWWTAQHSDGHPALHGMRLARRSGFSTTWRGDDATTAAGLRLPPTGPLQAVTEGATCDDHRALVLSGGKTRVALPDEPRPTEALGWLDRNTLLVSAGGCGDTVDLYAVDGLGLDAPAALAFDVDVAAPRTQVTNPPRTVPVPAPEEEPPPEGVG